MKYKAMIIESERGRGSKVDSLHEFDTKEERDQFVDDFNKNNIKPGPVPDWYMVAEPTN